MAAAVFKIGANIPISAETVVDIIKYGDWKEADRKRLAFALADSDEGKKILFTVAKIKQEREKKG
ncbi:MAG: hypothetical protein LBL65_05715 [Campylobacteraceae bacterium]|jgi:hypothetical protein|nr:hypothetical protein [Campylobacteraceae bacterium]